MGQFTESLKRFSTEMGTGNLALDLTVIAVVLAGIFFFAALIAWALGRRPEERDSRIDRFDTLLGRLERTERTIHEFRTDVLRALELLRTDLEFLRAGVETIRVTLHQDATANQVRERRPSREELATRLQKLPGFKPLVPSPGDASPAQIGSAQIGDEPSNAAAQEAKIAAHEPHKADQTVRSSGNRAALASVSLGKRLEKTRKGLLERFRGVFSSHPKVDSETIDELEAILVSSDLGVKNIREILAEVRADMASGIELNEGSVKAIVKGRILSLLEKGAPVSGIPTPRRNADGPLVILVVGINGAGKTTSAAKLAGIFKKEGAESLLVAADTFRAAAVEQLHEWGRRLGVPVVSGAENAKPQTVVYDAMQRAMTENIDCVIIDTAGRLHTKQSLMDELSGIRNAIEKHLPGAPHEILLVIDGSTGQNGLNQAREFNAATGVTGLVVTKLDGTSKGGILVAIKEELGIPVRYIGTGERAEDLEPFAPREFVDAIFAN